MVAFHSVKQRRVKSKRPRNLRMSEMEGRVLARTAEAYSASTRAGAYKMDISQKMSQCILHEEHTYT